MDFGHSESDPKFSGHKKNPLKRKRLDLDPDAPELHPEDTVVKRRRSEKDERCKIPERPEVGASCSVIKRESQENRLKRKRQDVSHERTEPHSKEQVEKKRKIDSSINTKEGCVKPKRKEGFFSHYSVKKLLGKGGFGSVYAGIRKSDGRKVALKFMKKPSKDTYITLPGDTRRLPPEVAFLKLVCKPPHSPHVIELLEWHETSKSLILVLERPDPCLDLHDYSRDAHLNENKARLFMQQVINAAIHCRDRGVFHRDIKTKNILVNPRTLEVKLIDFGCGQLHKDTPYTSFAGTRVYCPPEYISKRQYKAEPATVWSLGVLLYVMLCRQYPFIGNHEIVAGNINFPDYLSEECRSLISWCLQQDPKRRPTLEQILTHIWF